MPVFSSTFTYICIYTHPHSFRYTGEDGYEISIPHGDAVRITRALLDNSEVII